MKAASLLLALTLVGCGAVDVVTRTSSGGAGSSTGAVVGTGKAVSETRPAQAAESVVASDAIQVIVRKGSPKLVVSAQKEILKLLKTDFKDGALTLEVSGSTTSSEPIRVEYAAPSVSSLKGDGAVRFDADGLSGAASRIELSGASRATASGKVGTLTVTADGASQADLVNLDSENAKVDASGASQVQVRTNGALDAQADGASHVRYRLGKGGRIVRQETDGASKIEADR